MEKRVHFISGLPRSGSTLLCALLKQNPLFSAGMTSPVAVLAGGMHHKMCGGEFGVFFDDEKRLRMLRGILDTYYAHVPDGHVIFDTNRSWTGRVALTGELYPSSRIICCVRDIGWILDSVERMLNKNPAQLSRMFGFQTGTSVYGRVETLMNSEKGLIGLAWSTLREAWFGEHASRLLIVPYDHLVREPQRTMSRLYADLGEAPFAHDFNHVVYDEPDYDSHIGMPGLHTVRSKVAHQERMPCIPPDVFTKYAGASFWDKAELNTRGVAII